MIPMLKIRDRAILSREDLGRFQIIGSGSRKIRQSTAISKTAMA